MKRSTVITEGVEGVECELMYEPVDYLATHSARIGDKVVYAYCVHDTDVDYDNCMDCDGMGKLYSFHRHAPRDHHHAGLEALGNDRDGAPDLDKVWEMHEDEATSRYIKLVMEKHTLADIMAALDEGCEDTPTEEAVKELLLEDSANYNGWANVEYDDIMGDVLTEMWYEPPYFPGDKDACLLACYDHGSQWWSLSGGGMQCRWDTSNQAGVWVPDDTLREQLDSDEAKGLDRREQARIYCSQFLDTHNDVINGNVYGCVVEVFDADGKQIREDSCWGFVGDEHAKESLKTEFFEGTCKQLRSEYDEQSV